MGFRSSVASARWRTQENTLFASVFLREEQAAPFQKNPVMLIEEMLISAAECCWLQSMFSVSM
jgi:hypothetical protein